MATSAQTEDRRGHPAAWWCAWAAATGVLLVGFLLQLGGGPSATVPDDRRVTAAPSAYDTFTEDEGDAVDAADSGQRWVQVAGVWGVVDGRAAVVEPAPRGSNVLTLDTRHADGTFQVTIPVVAPGAGLVFRHRDEDDHWRVMASTRYSTWILEKVVDGEIVLHVDTGLVRVDDGAAIAVRFDGDSVVLFVDGAEPLAVTDPDPTGASEVGLLVTGADAGRVRFDDVSFFPVGSG